MRASVHGPLLGAVNVARKSERRKSPSLSPGSQRSSMTSQAHNAANDHLTSLPSALRKAVINPIATIPAPSASASLVSVPDGQLAPLQGVIEELKAEIDRSQKELMAQAAQTQVVFDNTSARATIAGTPASS
ncbi:hypothetical protein MSAN_00672700 [Mycena sanguinolenta]|uniref:Uncharacterized protein n=1 Tax=Mycena sanguinolenta TaxID=230812 RepID=A0A8H6Z0H9_9AGAR|nr:hypothetical protein MSAN_00672700 [Mycena sanguinolenta]